MTGQIAPAILDRRIPGLRDLTVWRRDERELDPSTGGEFITAMTFGDLAAVAAFTGGDPSTSVVPPSARQLLTHFDEQSEHYLSVRS
ncbi:MAG: antibiotic biosynthesis monooxygenase [Acidimicrobiales bacterium]